MKNCVVDGLTSEAAFSNSIKSFRTKKSKAKMDEENKAKEAASLEKALKEAAESVNVGI
jgi:hypothetical protein